MNRRCHLIAFGVLCASVGACSGALSGQSVRTSASDDLSQIEEDEVLDFESAKKLIADGEAQWTTSDTTRLKPKTLEDVLAILKRDEVTSFGAGIALASEHQGLQARALEAQIELAWGEAYMIVLELMMLLEQRYDEQLEKLKALKHLDPIQEAEAQWLRQQVQHSERFSDAFQIVSIEHMTRGVAKANEAIKQNPDNYLGYRVAADYYRMTRDWSGFHGVEEKIQKLNPNSNGLTFLRGTVAFHKDGDQKKAAAYFRQALHKDADFVRAQAHLLVIQEDDVTLMIEFDKLKKISPRHQVVGWLRAGFGWLVNHSVESVTQPQ
jgi:tetratricopeptide (TPR) repeat protein